MWTCPKCGSKVDAGFDICWKCGTTADGVEDPTFATADELPPIDGPSVTDITPEAPEPTPLDTTDELVECYSARDYLEAKFLADRLNDLGIPAFADSYDMHETLGSMNSLPKVRVRSDLLGPARKWLEEYELSRSSSAELE